MLRHSKEGLLHTHYLKHFNLLNYTILNQKLQKMIETDPTYEPEEQLLGPYHNGYGTIAMTQPQETNWKIGSVVASSLLAGLLLLISLILFLNLKLEAVLSLSAKWLYSLIPLVLLLTSLTISVSFAINNPYRHMKNLGKIMVTLLIFSVDVLVTVFNLLACLQADGVINIKHVTIFIPIFILIAVIFCFVCFITPGFLDTENRLYKEAALLLGYFFAVSSSIAFVSLRLDGLISWRWSSVFSPIFCVIGLHVIFLVKELTDKNSRFEYSEPLTVLLGTTFLVLATIHLNLKSRYQSSPSWSVIFSPIYILLTLGSIKALSLWIQRKKF